MEIELWRILPLIFIVAMLYSSIGHGGASGYLAVIGLLGANTILMRNSALILNLFVSVIAFYQFHRKGYFNWRLFYPFAISSIPMAYLGANIILDSLWYKRILGIFLVIAALRIAGVFDRNENDSIKELPIKLGIFIGAVLGFFSGMIGIGGGIILSPIILLSGWGNVKETAAVSALFIFVNSFAGLIGLGASSLSLNYEFIWWILIAILGGIIGSLWGSNIARKVILRNILAVIIFFAAIKLIFI